MDDRLNNILQRFILAYIVGRHTATEKAVEWIKCQIDKFLDNWYGGIKYGFLMPLVLCMQDIQRANDPNDYSSFFTLTLDFYRYKHTTESVLI